MGVCAVGRLVVRTRAAGASGDVGYRLRVESAVRSLDMGVDGLAPGAVLVVRHLRTELQEAGVGSVRDQLRDLARGAARPAAGAPGPEARAVVFDDEVQLLATLTVDILAGRARERWWWRELSPSRPIGPGASLAAAWSQRPRSLPGALWVIGPGTGVRGVAALSPAETSAVRRALCAAWEFPLARPVSSVPSFPAPASTSTKLVGHRPEPSGFPSASLRPDAADLLALALELHQAPASARRGRTAVAPPHTPSVEGATGVSEEPQPGGASPQLAAPAPPRTSAPVVPTGPPLPATAAVEAGPDKPHDAPPSGAAAPSWPDTTAPAAGSRVHRLAPDAVPAPPALVSAVPQSLRDDVTRPPGVLSLAETHEAGGVPTQVAGVLYLANLLVWLDLPGSWPVAANGAVGGWAILEALGRRLIGAGRNRDPLWGMLAAIEGRRPGDPVPGGRDAQTTGPVRLPAEWQRRWCPPPRRWGWYARGDRVVVQDRTRRRFTVANVAAGESPAKTAASEADRLCAAGIEGHLAERPMRPRPLPGWTDMVSRFIGCLLGSRGIATSALAVPGRVSVTRTHVDALFGLESVDIAVRQSGLDRDPGWVPDLGRIVTFHYT